LVLLSEKLTPADAAVMETFVVPRYLSLFGELALEMLLADDGARILHVGCRTGYPDRRILERLDTASIVGMDASLPALELARNKAAVLGETIEYRVAHELPTELESELYSHVLTLHPLATSEERLWLFRGMADLLYAEGQALVALPLRGSFQEALDLFAEYALKHEDSAFADAVEAAIAFWPTIETLSEELEGAGLDDVDVEIRQTELVFDSGRAFVEDPATRLLIIPELRSALDIPELSRPLDYTRDAIDKYWSETKFSLTVNVGCASARKP
jgi:ubiquinone/menaquinone biosynthesis C-methylase UbiE